MEEFGDWIYIILIIIAGVASLVNSTRKKARQLEEQNRQPRPVITDQSDNDDFWGTVSSQTETQPEIPVPSRQSVRQEYTSIKRSFLNIEQEAQSAIQATDMQTADIENEYSAITVEDMPNDTDEWRKAFIYNEIFSRKNG